ncbi:hypothetical protein CONCODRAFT_11700 [Conidiobolus coronatus NRRL 28638]|uniref:G-protein coupled receptors family 1 profile domain-containing protein n=1 Tax=Conidiobolus coronatus (strain ATCC 28846 / CBS 209.66 / NRRL 28638) TaxID=796925 RepID=A0A137NUL9_CONC2|nr:hypothetical protein CONCODRAFT_11700 [Conidiobolus coronatus NRRL 28638]|eukprot:KXN66447.1 hypothetical protein CONCODRAFT_11700 [Conidiobolus coronatus NRRL 28638]
MVVYHFLGVFTGKENKKSCNPGADNPTITKVVFGLIGLFNLIAIVSGIYVTIASHKRLGLWIETFSNKEILDPKDQETFKADKSKEAKRSFLYPLSSIITLTVEVILCFWMVVADVPYTMFYLNSIMTGFKGILTLITFLIDPSSQIALKYTFSRLRNRKSRGIEMSDL